MFPELVFQVVAIRILDVVRVVGKECKTGHLGRQLGDILDPDGVSPNGWRMIGFHSFQHDLNEPGGRYFPGPALKHFQGQFHRLEYPCLFFCRDEKNRHVAEWGNSLL